MRVAAVDAVRTGAAGSASMSRRAAESRRGRPARSSQEACSARTCASKRAASSTARRHADANNAIQPFVPACASAEPGGPTWRVPVRPST